MEKLDQRKHDFYVVLHGYSFMGFQRKVYIFNDESFNGKIIFQLYKLLGRVMHGFLVKIME